MNQATEHSLTTLPAPGPGQEQTSSEHLHSSQCSSVIKLLQNQAKLVNLKITNNWKDKYSVMQHWRFSDHTNCTVTYQSTHFPLRSQIGDPSTHNPSSATSTGRSSRLILYWLAQKRFLHFLLQMELLFTTQTLSSGIINRTVPTPMELEFLMTYFSPCLWILFEKQQYSLYNCGIRIPPFKRKAE